MQLLTIILKTIYLINLSMKHYCNCMISIEKLLLLSETRKSHKFLLL